MRKFVVAFLVAAVALPGRSGRAEEPGCTAPSDGVRIEVGEQGGSYVKLEWRAAGEGRTRLQLSVDAGFEKPLLIDRAVVGYRTQLYGLEAGTYHWRVLAGAEEGDPELCRASFDVVPRPKPE
jgi:hypothetical protein